MELILILRVLRRRWYLVLIPVAVVVVVAFTLPALLRDDNAAVSGGFSSVIRYTAAQELYAIPGRDGDFQDVWLASELTVNAFTEWVRTSRFAEEVAQEAAAAGVQINPEALAIAADNQRSIGQVFINWPDAAELEVITVAVLGVLASRNQAYFPQLGGVPAQVQVLDAPRITAAPPSLPNRLRPLIQVALALVAGVGLAFLVDYLDPTLRYRDELEQLGLTVTATIPRR